VQDNQQLAHFGQEYKNIQYEYDLVSGNVIKVSYQQGEPDQFYHKYAYDADNRLKEVFTSLLQAASFPVARGVSPGKWYEGTNKLSEKGFSF
jgi:YD repeat-containing protein